MSLKILCSGHLIRYPLGGFSWHHVQYLLGLQQLGHHVSYFEDFGWHQSCYDPSRHVMTGDPAYGWGYYQDFLQSLGTTIDSCYLAEDGRALGMDRETLAQVCREADVYINLSNINWIPELEYCRCRVLVDTDPVFTQIRGHGLGGPFSRYHARFTYGENIHSEHCSMPDGGTTWLPTRQPVVLDAWTPTPGPIAGSLSTVMNWSAYGDHCHGGQIFGQKNREFEPYWELPRRLDVSMELAINAPAAVKQRLSDSGWTLSDPLTTTLRPSDFQAFVRRSRAEFSVAKHAYVSTGSGWFSDRSCSYLASGRPVILQDTGFSYFLPCGEGLLCFRNPTQAVAAVRTLERDYQQHCRAARQIVEQCFNAKMVLTELLSFVC